MVEIVFDDEGRLVRPRGLRLRLPSSFIVEDDSKGPQETEEERTERSRRFWAEMDARQEEAPVRPWPKDDSIVEKFRRMGILGND